VILTPCYHLPEGGGSCDFFFFFFWSDRPIIAYNCTVVHLAKRPSNIDRKVRVTLRKYVRSYLKSYAATKQQREWGGAGGEQQQTF